MNLSFAKIGWVILLASLLWLEPSQAQVKGKFHNEDGSPQLVAREDIVLQFEAIFREMNEPEDAFEMNFMMLRRLEEMLVKSGFKPIETHFFTEKFESASETCSEKQKCKFVTFRYVQKLSNNKENRFLIAEGDMELMESAPFAGDVELKFQGISVDDHPLNWRD